MRCKGCKLDLPIVNKFHNLCLSCNNLRLYGSKYGKQYNNTLGQKKSLITPKKNKKARKSLFTNIKEESKQKLGFNNIKEEEKDSSNLIKDEILYEKCFNLSNHKCEECGKQLPTTFRGEDGKIIARWRYSHIIPKSIASELRHEVLNINNLCLLHHMKWENGDKESMKIFNSNSKKFPQYF